MYLQNTEEFGITVLNISPLQSAASGDREIYLTLPDACCHQCHTHETVGQALGYLYSLLPI